MNTRAGSNWKKISPLNSPGIRTSSRNGGSARNREVGKFTKMRREYDFFGGVRGKHAKAYRERHTVKIHKQDGTTEVHYFTEKEGAVMLDPDVKKFFPDSKSVNKALRSLIAAN